MSILQQHIYILHGGMAFHNPVILSVVVRTGHYHSLRVYSILTVSEYYRILMFL